MKNYLDKKSRILAERRADFQTDPEKAWVKLSAKSAVAGETGARPTYMGQFYLLSDSSPALAGNALGPTAPEMLLGALASCLVHTYLIQAALLQIPLEHVEIEVSGALDMRGVVGLPADAPPCLQQIAYFPRVESSAEPEALQALHAAVDATCPVLNTLRFAMTIPQQID